ncbi:MAG: PDZ domain-containing protein [Cyclobacteriaceae bacterium]
MNSRLFALLLFAFTSILTPGQSQELKRKANLGFGVRKISNSPGATVSRIDEQSAAYKAGLRKGDRVFTISGQSIEGESELYKHIWAIRSNDIVKLEVAHANEYKSNTIQFKAEAAPPETWGSLDAEMIQLINSSGDKLRGFVTKPKNSRGKIPAILFVSWLSCGTVEIGKSNDSWTRMLRDVAEKSGALFLRVEKPGVGDSEGPACMDCDLYTELDGYKAAFHYLKQRNDVDTTNIIVFGASLGGTLASIVGQDQPVKAYVSAVSVYKTWLEHMIEIERRRLQYAGHTQEEINQLMPLYIEFHTDYLIYKKTPKQIMEEKPHLASIWYDEPKHQYGRPALFYQQAQAYNFMNTWSEVKQPVYVVAGEYDWIMTLEDSKLMVDMLNQKKQGQATLFVAKGMDHHWSVYNSPQEAFDETNGKYAEETVSAMIDWMKKMMK